MKRIKDMASDKKMASSMFPPVPPLQEASLDSDDVEFSPEVVGHGATGTTASQPETKREQAPQRPPPEQSLADQLLLLRIQMEEMMSRNDQLQAALQKEKQMRVEDTARLLKERED